MSLYELESMMRSLNTLDKPVDNSPSDEEWADAEALLAEATAGISDVRL